MSDRTAIMDNLVERLRYVAAANTEASLRHPDLLRGAADEIEKLRLALEVAGDFACFDPPTNDPCECCLHVTEIVNGALGAPLQSGSTSP